MPYEVGAPVGLDIGPALSALDKLTAADAAFRGEQQKTAAAASAAFSQYGGQLTEVVAESRAAAAAQRQFAGDIAGLVKEIRDQAAAQRDAQRAASEAAAERRKANAETRAAAAAEKAAAKEVVEAEKQVAAAAKLAARESANATKEAEKSGGAASGLGKVFGSLQGQIAAAFSIAAVKAFIGNVIEAGQAAEATLSKLTFANGGDAQAAARDLAFVRNEADRLGLELNTTGKSYGSFVAAAAAGNFPLADARKLFLATAGASATLKLSADDTQGVLLALTQILSKGTVSAEELRGQIGERLPGAFSIAAKSIGVTEQQLNKLLQTGQLKSTDFLPKFAEELQKTFGDGTAQAADSFSANINRIENEFNAFFLRFQGAASKGTSTIAGIFRHLNEALDLRSAEGRQRLGEQRAQQGIKDYEATLTALLAEAEAQAKATNQSEEQAAIALLARQRGGLKAELAAAQQEAKRIEGLSVFEQLQFPGGRDALREASVQAQQRVALLSGEIAKNEELAAARKKANDPKDLEGLIKKQEDLIKALKARQQAATKENQGDGGDFLFGKGGLNAALKAAQVELDRLLGKVDKAAADRLAAALRALATARAELQTKAAAATTKDADDAATRARLAFEEQLRQADIIKQKLIEREAAVRKAGGRGKNADGVIDGVQDAQLAALRVAALDAYYEELGKIEIAREQRLFDLRADSNQKEVEQIDRKYDKLIKAAKDGIERQAIEEARQREQLALQAQQQQKAIDNTASLSTARATAVGATFGAGTGVSVIEAKEAEKRALLEIERKHAQDTLNNSLLLSDKEGQLARANATTRLAQVSSELRAIDQEKAKHKADDFVYKLLFGENDSDELRSQFEQTATQVIGTINQILSAQLAAEQAKVQAHQDNITSLQAQLSAEIQLNAEGSASNIKATLDQIAAEKAAKKEALAQSREIAKQQQAINDLQAISAIGLAVANIIAGWSTVPIAGSILGIVAAAATVASFVATKASARSAAQTESFFKGGLGTTGYTGDGNPHDESRALGHKDYTYHRQEYILPHEVTQQFRRSLLEPLHTGRHQDINWDAPEMRALLPDLELPGKMRAEKAAYVEHHHRLGMEPMRADFDRMHDRLAAIEGSNREMADKPDAVAVAGGYLLTWPNGSTKLVKVT